MDWASAVGYGALGGLLVEVVISFGHLTDWREARRRARLAGRRRLPAITKFIDPLADGLVAASRILLGAGTGLILHNQVVGAAAAIAAGASAPALLRQFASARTLQEAISGGETVSSASEVNSSRQLGNQAVNGDASSTTEPRREPVPVQAPEHHPVQEHLG